MKRYFINTTNAVLFLLSPLALLTIGSSTAAAAGAVLWSADMSGNTSQWSAKGAAQ